MKFLYNSKKKGGISISIGIGIGIVFGKQEG